MKNPWTARTIMILVIVFSVLYGSHRSLAKEASKIEFVFYNGIGGDGFSIANDLSARVDESRNLLTIAKRSLDEDDPSIKAVSEALQGLADAEDLSAKYRSNRKLTEAYTELGGRLAAAELSERDESYLSGILDELRSRNSIIGHDGYNELAESFNARLGKFPANILSRLTGVKPLPLFR